MNILFMCVFTCAFSYFLISGPLPPPPPPPPNSPLGHTRLIFIWRTSPWGLEELIVFSLCPFPDESAGVYQIWWQLVHPFGSYSRFVNFWPPKTPQNAPSGIEGLIVFSLCPFPDESAGVYQLLCHLVHPFGSYSRFLNFWPPKTPQNSPWV